MYSIGLPMDDIHLPEFITNSLDPDTAWNYLKIDVDDALMPLWMGQSILLLGFALLFFRFFQLLLNIIKGTAQGFKLADESKESMHLIQKEPSLEADTQEHTK
jgi:C4-dicarboxylate transporter DctQ subunit